MPSGGDSSSAALCPHHLHRCPRCDLHLHLRLHPHLHLHLFCIFRFDLHPHLRPQPSCERLKNESIEFYILGVPALPPPSCSINARKANLKDFALLAFKPSLEDPKSEFIEFCIFGISALPTSDSESIEFYIFGVPIYHFTFF